MVKIVYGVLEEEMKQKWFALVAWFRGKKTYIGGSLLMLAGVGGVFLGKVSVTDGFGLLSAGFSICGLAAKLDRHHSAALTAIETAAQIGLDARAHNLSAIKADLQPLVADAVQVAIAKGATGA